MKIVYVGQSKNMYNRICQHVREITKDLPLERKYQLLHNAWLKTQNPEAGDTHDVRGVGFEILERCEECDLKVVEQEWIDYYKPHLNTVGMNDNKTIDERIKFDNEIFWLLELGNGWLCFE